jgi:hypothetical protein
MEHARIDISQDLDGDTVVVACFDLTEKEIAASTHAVAALGAERFRTSAMSSDDVLELRELTALADELGESGAEAGMRTVVFKPARLAAFRDAVTGFVEARDEAEWIRDEDREPLTILRGMLLPLEQLSAEAMRAALSPEARSC